MAQGKRNEEDIRDLENEYNRGTDGRVSLDDDATFFEAMAEDACPQDASFGCKACERPGIPILPLRRVLTAQVLENAWWHHDNSAFASKSTAKKDQVLPLCKAVMNTQPQLRTLRRGFLYVYLQPRKGGDTKVVHAYQVTLEGHLRRFYEYKMRYGRPASLPRGCVADGHDIKASFINIDDEKFSKAWLAFSNDCWPGKVIDAYAKSDVFDQRFVEVDIDALKQGDGLPPWSGLLKQGDISYLEQQVLEYKVNEEAPIFTLHGFYSRYAKRVATQDFVRSAVAKHGMAAVPALVLPDPVGDVQETNHLRNSLVMDKKKWESSEQRAYMFSTSVEMGKIRSAKVQEQRRERAVTAIKMAASNYSVDDPASNNGGEIIAASMLSEEQLRTNWDGYRKAFGSLRPYETYEDAVKAYMPRQNVNYAKIDERLNKYCKLGERKDFNEAFGRWNNVFIRAINHVTQLYVSAFEHKLFELVAQHDYTDDNVKEPDERVSATSFTRLIAGALEGGPSDMALYEASKEANSSFPWMERGEIESRPSTLLWERLIDDYDGLFAKALFRRRPDLRAKLEEAANAEYEAEQAYVQTLKQNHPSHEAWEQARDDAERSRIMSLHNAMFKAVYGIVNDGDKLIVWLNDKSMQRSVAVLRSACANAAEQLNSLDMKKAALAAAQQAQANAKQAQADAQKAQDNARQAQAEAKQAQDDAQKQASQDAQALEQAETDMENKRLAANEAQAKADGAQKAAGEAQEQANAKAQQAQEAAEKVEPAQQRADDARTANSQAQGQVNTAQTDAQKAQAEAERLRSVAMQMEAEMPRPREVMQRYSALIYDNRVYLPFNIPADVEDIKYLPGLIEDMLAQIHRSAGGEKLPRKARWLYALTSSDKIAWRHFQEVRVPAKYLPADFLEITDAAKRSQLMQQAVERFAADEPDEFKRSRSFSSSDTKRAVPSNKKRMTLLKWLVPGLYNQYLQGVASGAGEEARQAQQRLKEAQQQAEQAEANNRQAQERLKQAQADAGNAQGNTQIAQAELEQAQSAANRAADELKTANETLENAQAEAKRTAEAAQTAAGEYEEAKRTTQQAEDANKRSQGSLETANENTRRADGEVNRTGQEVTDKTTDVNNADDRVRNAQSDVDKQQGVSDPAIDAHKNAELEVNSKDHAHGRYNSVSSFGGAGLDLLAIYFYSQSLENAAQAMKKTVGKAHMAEVMAYYSALTGIVGSSVAVAGGVGEGVLAWRMTATVAKNSMAYILAGNMVKGGAVICAFSSLLEAMGYAYKASAAQDEKELSEVVTCYYLAAGCSLVAGVGGVMVIAMPVVGLVVAVTFAAIAAILVHWADANRTQPLEAWLERCVFGLGVRDPASGQVVKGYTYQWSSHEHMNTAFSALSAAWLGLLPQLSFRMSDFAFYREPLSAAELKARQARRGADRMKPIYNIWYVPATMHVQTMVNLPAAGAGKGMQPGYSMTMHAVLTNGTEVGLPLRHPSVNAPRPLVQNVTGSLPSPDSQNRAVMADEQVLWHSHALGRFTPGLRSEEQLPRPFALEVDNEGLDNISYVYTDVMMPAAAGDKSMMAQTYNYTSEFWCEQYDKAQAAAAARKPSVEQIKTYHVLDVEPDTLDHVVVNLRYWRDVSEPDDYVEMIIPRLYMYAVRGQASAGQANSHSGSNAGAAAASRVAA